MDCLTKIYNKHIGRPRVFGYASIICLVQTERSHLTQLFTALSMPKVGRVNVVDPFSNHLALIQHAAWQVDLSR
jgi:hypothetical protein